MSTANVAWVFSHSPYTLGKRLIHLALADVANDDYEDRLWLTREALARKAAVSVKSVDRAIREMLAEGYLELIAQGGGRGHPSEYRLVKPGPKGRQDVAVSGGEKGDILSPKQGHHGRERATSTDSRLLSTQGNTRGNTTSTRKTSLQPALDGTESDPLHGFEHFWQAYPQRHGKRIGRRLCEGMWAKLPIADRRAAYRGACHYATAVATGLTLPKDPERFLRHRVWEDWQEPAAADAPVARPDPRRRAGASIADDLARAAELEARRKQQPPTRRSALEVAT